MALSIIEAIKAQTTSSAGSLVATFSATPQIGDRIIAFVMFESSSGDRDSASFVVSGLGATWRLLYSQSGYSSQTDWFGVYEAINVDGVGSAVSATESSSATTNNFAISCFNVRGVPTGTLASPLYGITSGINSNPPVLSVAPMVAGDVVMGSWYQQSSASAPTVTTVPVSGWSSFSVTMASMSVHWRYIVSGATTSHTADSGTSAMYVSFGLASQTGSARIEYGGVEAVTTQTAPLRRYSVAGAEVMISAKNHRYNQVMIEALTTRIPFTKGWGVSI
jgi:hypothetical protein